MYYWMSCSNLEFSIKSLIIFFKFINAFLIFFQQFIKLGLIPFLSEPSPFHSSQLPLAILQFLSLSDQLAASSLQFLLFLKSLFRSELFGSIDKRENQIMRKID